MTARIVVIGTPTECAATLKVLDLAADVKNVEIGPELDGRVCVGADVLPSSDAAPIPARPTGASGR